MNRNSKGNVRKTHENKNIEDLLESDPINNLLMWENLFYEKYKKIGIYLKEHPIYKYCCVLVFSDK